MRILVTGCGGFLGAEIVRQLIRRGDTVTGVARGSYPELESLGMKLHRGDLTESTFVRGVVRDIDAVIHTAAKAGVWGDWDDYYAINKQATDSLIQACRDNAVRTLVYTSSPSVTFDGEHQSGVDESVPYATNWMCHYPHTKALAEQAVIAAHRHGELHTVSLRPHLIWGEDDPHILPRIVDRARSGRLRIVGDGKNRVDTVHVVNAAAAHVDALDALSMDPQRCGGRAYFITQDEPVNCWDWIGEVCEIHGVHPPTKRISVKAASRIGGVLETVYRVLGRKQEPPMTRFVAAQLAKDHYFNIAAAKQLLSYRPRITMREGLERLKQKVARQG
jgi:2-alkyl-3-oxoalkanoate reductase